MAVDMNKLVSGDSLLYALKGLLTGKIATLLDSKVDKVEGKGLSTNDYTTAEKTKLSSIAAGANKYVHPSATARASGLYKIVVDALGHVTGATAVTKADITGLGIPAQDTTYSAFKGATASAAGAAGLVPAPGTGNVKQFLAGDGTWATPNDTTYSDATQSAHGLMTAADKKKLDGIADGANKYTLPAAGSALGGVKTTSTVASASGYTAVPIIDGVPYYKDTNTTYKAATSSANGLMTAADKAKLDAFGAASTYATQSYVGQQIAAAGHMTKSIVTALPAVKDAKENVIYLIKKSDGSGDNLYDEYMLIDGALELVGDSATKIETLSNADIDEILAAL